MPDANDKPKQSLSDSFKDISLQVKAFWQRVQPHLGFMYATVLLLGITYVVYIVTQSLNSNIAPSAATPHATNDFSIRFDDATINKVRALSGNGSANTNVTLPEGRINPFSE